MNILSLVPFTGRKFIGRLSTFFIETFVCARVNARRRKCIEMSRHSFVRGCASYAYLSRIRMSFEKACKSISASALLTHFSFSSCTTATRPCCSLTDSFVISKLSTNYSNYFSNFLQNFAWELKYVINSNAL